MTDTVAPPQEIRVTPDRRTLVLVQAGGARQELSAEMLRVMSPSAEVQGHSPDQRKTVGGKIDVAIASVAPVGNYAVRIG
ncbi:MAG: gamma-butyrobetaine hydroxylase-like domain-containing protein, partial [Aurantimonas coralicida]|nr:gamma-butyrobetaine hydroxylase-like domain-containing protein [Aurantimonas coralicida]